MQTIKEQVKSFVLDNFMMRQGEDLADDVSFLGRGILDSTGVLELVSYLEGTFHIEVGDEEMVPENLDSLDAIEAYLKRKGARS